VPPIEPTRKPDPPPSVDPPADEDPGFEPVEDEADRWSAPAARLPVARPYDPRLARWVRGMLVLIAAGFTAIFGVAAWLRPYDADGTPRTMATHTQLGLPPCNMVALTGRPCPACGMTTSFALLAHGDVANSLRANWVGTLLAAFLLVMIPWAIASAARGRYYFIRSGEALTTVVVLTLLVLMLGRWGVILLQG
jgi:hypothetical protein